MATSAAAAVDGASNSSSSPSGDVKKPASAKPVEPDLNFDKQLRQNLASFIPLLIVSLMITGAGAGLATQAAMEVLDQAANSTEVYNQIKGGTVPKSNFFLIGTILAGFGIFVMMVVVVTFLDRRERIVNRRKIIEEEARLQKLKAKPKNIFDVLLSAARGQAAANAAAASAEAAAKKK